MKILALSDLCWNNESKKISLEEVSKMTCLEILENTKFNLVKSYFNIVTENSPNLILFCGDITGDGSSGHGFTSALFALLKLIESKKIQTRYLSGNHDEEQYINQIKNKFISSKYIKEFSNKIETIKGIKIIGLSHYETKNKSIFKKLLTSEKIDILACHCEHKDRLKLFEFNTDYIITGHYDLKVINPNNTTFISLENDSSKNINYVTIVKDEIESHISLEIINSNNENSYYTYKKTNKSFNKKYIINPLEGVNYINNISLEKLLEKLILKKKKNLKISEKELNEYLKIKISRNQNVSLSFLSPFLKIDVKNEGKVEKPVHKKLIDDNICENDFPSTVTDFYWVCSSSKKSNIYPKKFKTFNSGKWLLFVNIKDVDSTWQIVKKATENGLLGPSSKVATSKENLNSTSKNERVICVYTYNWLDVDDVYRIEKTLRSIGINCTLYYKADTDTKDGIYKVNGSLNISKYISKATISYKKYDLLSLHCIGEDKIEILNNIGINNFDDLLSFDTSKKLEGVGITTEYINKIKISALSHVEKKIYRLSDIKIPKGEIVHFDIETDLSLSYNNKRIWSIALYHNKKVKRFYAETWEKEKEILNDFIQFIKKIENPILFSYSGRGFDKNILTFALKRHNLDYEYFLNCNHNDLCTLLRQNYVMPIKGYGLKDVGKFLGFNFKNDDFNGLYVAQMYVSCQKYGKKLPNEIFEYIEDDVKSMDYIFNELINRKDIKDIFVHNMEKQ